MPLWHCPHCGTAQAESARCWVCKRSSTTCRTCRNFRSAVAGGLGYCAVDRGRSPLRGDEVRGCWESAAPAASSADGARSLPPAHLEEAGTGRSWMEVAAPGPSSAATLPGRPAPRPPQTRPEPAEAPEGAASPPARRSAIDAPPTGLWGEIEP